MYFMVNEETLKRTPPEMLEYLRYLRRRIQELESTDPQQRIEELEATIRKLQVEVEDLNAAQQQQQQQIQQLQQQLADARAKLGTNSTNSSLPPSSDRFHGKRRPPPPPTNPARNAAGSPAIRGTSVRWFPRSRSAKPSLASPQPVAVAASP